MTSLALAAVVLAGGAARRLGGVRKPTLPVAGRPMLDRVLRAVGGARPRIVVGPADLTLPADVLNTTEDPPGGGPVAAAAAGLALVPPETPYVAMLAADLPLLTAAAVTRLIEQLRSDMADGAVYLDEAGRLQLLCGVWRTARLEAAVHRLVVERGDPSGVSMRRLVEDLRVTGVSWGGAGAPPWFDCDTDADLQRAEEWAR